MGPPIHHMTVIRYHRDDRPWESERIESRTWAEVETAVRRMENYCFQWVSLNTTDDDIHENVFNVMGALPAAPPSPADAADAAEAADSNAAQDARDARHARPPQ